VGERGGVEAHLSRIEGATFGSARRSEIISGRGKNPEGEEEKGWVPCLESTGNQSPNIADRGGQENSMKDRNDTSIIGTGGEFLSRKKMGGLISVSSQKTR